MLWPDVETVTPVIVEGSRVKAEIYYRQLVSGERQGFADRLLLKFLELLSIMYTLVMRWRAVAYACGVLPIKRLPVPVISVGNITMGGTGKTPTVLMLTRELMARGLSVAVLTRGYGGSLEGETRVVSDGKTLLLTPAEAGDEPCLLASSLPGLMVIMGSDRYSAGKLALSGFTPDCFILDDGFQHQRLARDLDIVLLDSSSPFGNGRTVPAGFLREPLSALKRAGLVIFTRCEPGATLPEKLPVEVNQCCSSHMLTGYTPLRGGDLHPFTGLDGRRIIAFCGIAAPASFFEALELCGVKLVSTLAFPDHTEYGPKEMEALGRLKRQFRADCFITTAKDAVKLAPYDGIIGDCFVAQLELCLHDPGILSAALDKLFCNGGSP
jgi:tetraacyldisaccharide 4'-kinase